MKIKSIIVDDEKHGRENLVGRQILSIRSEICTHPLIPTLICTILHVARDFLNSHKTFVYVFG